MTTRACSVTLLPLLLCPRTPTTRPSSTTRLSIVNWSRTSAPAFAAVSTSTLSSTVRLGAVRDRRLVRPGSSGERERPEVERVAVDGRDSGCDDGARASPTVRVPPRPADGRDGSRSCRSGTSHGRPRAPGGPCARAASRSAIQRTARRRRSRRMSSASMSSSFGSDACPEGRRTRTSRLPGNHPTSAARGAG